MKEARMRYFVTFLIIALLIFFGVIIFGGKPKSNNGHPANVKTLADYSTTDARVELTTDGPINGDSQHRQIRIIIDQNSRQIDIIQGYQGHVISSKSYTNNQTAYNVFLHALDIAGFTKQRKTSLSSEVGVCPLGDRFIFQLIGTGSNKTDTRQWSTTCTGGSQGGSVGLLRTLFQNQIDDYDNLTTDVIL